MAATVPTTVTAGGRNAPRCGALGDLRERAPTRCAGAAGCRARRPPPARRDRPAVVAAARPTSAGKDADAHVEDERAGEGGQRRPVDRALGLAGILVRRHEGDRRGHVAMGDRDAGVGGRRHTGGHAGHDLERHAGLDQRLRLLAAAAEDERVAALEAHDGACRPCACSTSSALISSWDIVGRPAPCRRRRSAQSRPRALAAAASRPAGRRRSRRRARSARVRAP